MAFQPRGIKASLLTREAEKENQICPVKSCCFHTECHCVGKEAAGTVCSGSVLQNIYGIIYTSAITHCLYLWISGPITCVLLGESLKQERIKLKHRHYGENDRVVTCKPIMFNQTEWGGD